MKLKVRIALFVIFAAVIGGFYYAYFPAINIHLEIFWTTLIVVFLSLAIILGAKSSISQMVGRLSKKPSIKEFSWFAKLCSVLVIVCVENGSGKQYIAIAYGGSQRVPDR